MAKCTARLKTISQLSAIESGDKAGVGDNERPLEGLEIAITISGSLKSVADPNEDADDVCYKENSEENLKKLIQALKNNDIPPTVDFVTGNEFDPKMVEIWLQSGNLIGNMAYTKKVATHLAAESFIENVGKVHAMLEPLLAKYSQKERYFRYPHSKPSRNKDVRDKEGAYLTDNKYVVVPKTVTGYDQEFARIYCPAAARGDTACVNLIKANFFPLLLDSIQRARKLARKATGATEPKQILEFKANQFTIDMLDSVMRRLKELGVRFVPIDEAIRDPLYSMTSRRGMPMAFTIRKRVEREQSGGRGNSAGVE